MTIRKTLSASAIALVLGFAASAQAGSDVAIDHYTAETNPAVFTTSTDDFNGGSSVETADHYTEETQPHVFGTFTEGDAETVDLSDVLPYQRG